MWSSISLAPVRHACDDPSTSEIKVGKNNRTIKFTCMLCEGDHHSHLHPHMDEDSYLLENLKLPTNYYKISPNLSLVDGWVNLVPSLVSLDDQVVNLVSSSVEPVTQVVDLVLSSISPTLNLKSEPKVVDLSPSSIDPTPSLRISDQVVSPSP